MKKLIIALLSLVLSISIFADFQTTDIAKLPNIEELRKNDFLKFAKECGIDVTKEFKESTNKYIVAKDITNAPEEWATCFWFYRAYKGESVQIFDLGGLRKKRIFEYNIIRHNSGYNNPWFLTYDKIDASVSVIRVGKFIDIGSELVFTGEMIFIRL